jgi:hypothetical protein
LDFKFKFEVILSQSYATPLNWYTYFQAPDRDAKNLPSGLAFSDSDSMEKKVNWLDSLMDHLAQN